MSEFMFPKTASVHRNQKHDSDGSKVQTSFKPVFFLGSSSWAPTPTQTQPKPDAQSIRCLLRAYFVTSFKMAAKSMFDSLKNGKKSSWTRSQKLPRFGNYTPTIYQDGVKRLRYDSTSWIRHGCMSTR
jgi:hypothetical protein